VSFPSRNGWSCRPSAFSVQQGTCFSLTACMETKWMQDSGRRIPVKDSLQHGSLGSFFHPGSCSLDPGSVESAEDRLRKFLHLIRPAPGQKQCSYETSSSGASSSACDSFNSKGSQAGACLYRRENHRSQAGACSLQKRRAQIASQELAPTGEKRHG
jgi:hypothetical protein